MRSTAFPIGKALSDRAFWEQHHRRSRGAVCRRRVGRFSRFFSSVGAADREGYRKQLEGGVAAAVLVAE